MPSIAEVRTSRPPVRMAHLGLGNFHRAHQAWYTQRANLLGPEPDAWGIADFTGRSPRTADALAAQDDVYTLISRSADGDSAEIMQPIVEAHDGGSPAWERTLADPAVAVLTVTVTERGYEAADQAGR
jgi:fructuronate reductase